MKLIDEKGRLFGKANIVDLFVVIIVVAIVAAVGYRFLSPDVNNEGTNPLTEDEYCYVTLYCNQMVPEMSQTVKVGDKLVANGKYTDAEIVAIGEKPAAYVGYNSDGVAVLSDHPLWKDLTVIVKEKVSPNNVILKVGDQEVRVGYQYIFKTQRVESGAKVRRVQFESELSSQELELINNNQVPEEYYLDTSASKSLGE